MFVHMHCFTHLTHVSGNFRRFRTGQRKRKSSESYAFAKPIFYMNLLVPLRCQAATISSAITTLSTICLPEMKVDCAGLTKELITSRSRFAKALAMIRYKELDREIGRKSPTCSAPWHFGISTKRALFNQSMLHILMQKSSIVAVTSGPTRSQHC